MSENIEGLINVIFQDEDGTPLTGLTPQITVYEIGNSDPTTKAVDAQAMTEIGNGIYQYNFTDRHQNKYYYAFADGGASITNNWYRYKYGEVSRFKIDGSPR